MRDYKREELFPHTSVLSSTQVLDYARSPKDFYVTWVVGFEKKASPAMELGRIFSELYADRKFDPIAYVLENKMRVSQKMLNFIVDGIKNFPKSQNPELELICEYKDWKIRATLDDLYEKECVIVENKTGQLVWNQEVSDNYEQVTLQQWVYWKKFGKLPKYTIVNWLDLYDGSIHTFKTKRRRSQLEIFEKSVIIPTVDGIKNGYFG